MGNGPNANVSMSVQDSVYIRNLECTGILATHCHSGVMAVLVRVGTRVSYLRFVLIHILYRPELRVRIISRIQTAMI